MSHVSDHFRSGNAGFPGDSRMPLGRTDGTMSPADGKPGAKMTPSYLYQITPLIKQVDNIALAQTVSGGALVLTAGTGVSTTSINNVTYLAMDVCRAVNVIGASGATATDITIAGLDQYLVPLTNTISGPGSGATVTSTKCFMYIASVTTAGNPAQNLTVGATDIFEFPERVDNFGQVLINWNNAVITANTGFTAAVTTSPATATTGDVRGKYNVQSASDGAKILSVVIFPLTTAINTMDGLYGVQQV